MKTLTNKKTAAGSTSPRTLLVATALLLASLAPLQAAGVVHSVTGSGRLSIYEGAPYNDLLAINAQLRADGKVTGQVQCTDWEMGFTFHGEVFDLKVEGNMAKLAWKMTRGPTSVFEDCQYGFVVVIDNGEGHNA